MNGIEQMRWAKDLISEKTNGLQELVVGNMHDELYIRTSDKATVGLYLSMLPNRKTGQYDCLFKAYTRTCGGYNISKKMQVIADEYQSITDLLSQLETAKISLTGDELNTFVKLFYSIDMRLRTY
ncbi:hypothetical protein EQM14_15130 [Caproiciproducens sp. NJN-50]|uniref:hypothetical protein n=1 Tax=Caproiciproducens sp. NJN-50 TaxID=2507162 RepID=UPI000FFE228C|nr:hypothetical protein [Caproiciproducens sp. NJN-50]QAT50992.1 hypothetical protein EQM14_15130 [Caproiciproducens sp. NJN-50]